MSNLSLSLNALAVPGGTEFPGNVAALLTLLTEYIEIAGTDNFNGINFGQTEPSADDRDKPWYRFAEDGEPMGWFGWNGSAWKLAAMRIPSGPTANRPSPAEPGEKFFDTDINVELVFERSQWRTASGSPGDIKFVKADTLEIALTNNPGWSEFEEMRGRVPGGAGAGDGLTERAHMDEVGEEEHTLSTNEIPAHTHTVTPRGETSSSTAGPYIESAPGPGSNLASLTSASTGGDEPHNNMQPTLFLWCLKKD